MMNGDDDERHAGSRSHHPLVAVSPQPSCAAASHNSRTHDVSIPDNETRVDFPVAERVNPADRA